MKILLLSLMGLFATWYPLMGADAGPHIKLALHLAEDKPTEKCKEETVSSTRQKVYLHPEALLTEKDVAEANVTQTDKGEPAISVIFTREGGKKMATLTEANQGKRLAIVVDGKVINAPVIRSKIVDRAVITGRFTKAEAEKIAKEINRK